MARGQRRDRRGRDGRRVEIKAVKRGSLRRDGRGNSIESDGTALDDGDGPDLKAGRIALGYGDDGQSRRGRNGGRRRVGRGIGGRRVDGAAAWTAGWLRREGNAAVGVLGDQP